MNGQHAAFGLKKPGIARFGTGPDPAVPDPLGEQKVEGDKIDRRHDEDLRITVRRYPRAKSAMRYPAAPAAGDKLDPFKACIVRGL
jgi:hypothetical protein